MASPRIPPPPPLTTITTTTTCTVVPKVKEKEQDLERRPIPNSLSAFSVIGRNKLNSKIPTAPVLTSSATRNDNGIEALRYEETNAGKLPIPVIRPPPRDPPTETHPALRDSGLTVEDSYKRDSGLATTTTRSSTSNSKQERQGSLAASTIEEKEKELGIKIDFDSNSALANSVSFVPTTPMSASDDGLRKSETRSSGVGSLRWSKPRSKKSRKSATENAMDYSPLTTPIPTEKLMDEETLNSIQFSKRGSLMLLGTKAVNGHARPNATRRKQSFSMLASPTRDMLPEETEKESQKVRSMYEQGSKLAWEEGRYSSLAQKMSGLTTEPTKPDLLARPSVPSERPDSTLSVRNEHELAGGIEDWEDVEGEDVDRYGFIDVTRRSSRPGTPEPRILRVSTMLQLVSEAPRKKRKWGRGTLSSAASLGTSQKKSSNRKVSSRSLVSEGSISSQRSSGPIRSVSNRLPGNRDRRWVDEASDMLTLPPGLSAIAENEEGGKAAAALKNKEIERVEKWRKMAKVVKTGADGQGMEFQFNPRNPKLIERTWKGIPDTWRSSAWWSFLADSAAKRSDTIADRHLIAHFHESQLLGSAEDGQIDLDMPRTIANHIMFRKRYSGGQRLMFRVLHAFSLFFPEPGYVQGMAAIAATLLCYYDEEQAFIMMVRMWTLRGLDKLYALEFKGLIAALTELRQDWLAGRDISKKLEQLHIDDTAWGIRWYLTLFNYSIPFPAQLRVWDVFMLLGDIDPTLPVSDDRPYQGGLDILHATSAALMDATREVIMHADSDFENVMKALTGWIPVKDEELLMKVVRAEWKLHIQQQKKGACNKKEAALNKEKGVLQPQINGDEKKEKA